MLPKITLTMVASCSMESPKGKDTMMLIKEGQDYAEKEAFRIILKL